MYKDSKKSRDYKILFFNISSHLDDLFAKKRYKTFAIFASIMANACDIFDQARRRVRMSEIWTSFLKKMPKSTEKTDMQRAIGRCFRCFSPPTALPSSRDYSIVTLRKFNTPPPTVELLTAKSSTFKPSLLNSRKQIKEVLHAKSIKNVMKIQNISICFSKTDFFDLRIFMTKNYFFGMRG